jgi:hypothetical protein
LGLTILGVFAFIWASNFLIHGLILKSAYAATASLWRPEAEMCKFFMYLLGGQLVISIFFSWIFAKGYEGKGWQEGVRFGLLIGLFSCGPTLISYAVSPLPCSIACAWMGLGLIQYVLAGIVASLIYKKAPATV